MLPAGYILRLLPRFLQPGIGVVMGLSGAALFAQATPDPIERSIEFVDKCAAATELYNQQHYQEALSLFESLSKSYGDLDTDGFVALGLGDCLVGLRRFNDAKNAYVAFTPRTPAQQTALRDRLDDLELKGTVSDIAIGRFRAAAQQIGPDRVAAAWRLGRALQKRAADMLDEAAQAFRVAADAPGEKPCSSEQLLNQSAYLNELAEDLKFLINEVEGYMRIPANLSSPNSNGIDRPHTQQQSSQLKVHTPDGRELNIHWDYSKGSPGAFQFEGRDVKLTPAQLRLLQRHQDRIVAIMLEAAGESAPASGAPSGSADRR